MHFLNRASATSQFSLTWEHLADRLLLATETDMMWSLEREDIIKAYADTDELKRVLYP